MSRSVTSRSSAESSRSPLWQWPVAGGVLAAAVAAALSVFRPADGTFLGSLPGGDMSTASGLLQVTATSVMTATTLAFSLTVLALQLASQQFSPRLLREFTRDPVTKLVLGVLAGAFAYSTTGLLVMGGGDQAPRLLVIGTYVLAVASLVAVLGFITHIARAVRVDTMMLMVHDDAVAAIDRFYPPYGEESPPPPTPARLADAWPVRLTASRSGFVQRTDVEALVACARAHDAFVEVGVRPGDHVVRGTPIANAWIWGHPDDRHIESLCDSVQEAITFDYERTMDQDTGFAFRQLEDIAVKAMSPSINDPVTADHSVGHMADLLVRLMDCRLGPTVHQDAEGSPRASVPDRDLAYYLDLACGQLRRFGATEPTVLSSLLRMLRDAAVACRDDAQREAVRRAAELVATQAEGVRPADRAGVDDLSARVHHALSGDFDVAYNDESGRTRSM